MKMLSLQITNGAQTTRLLFSRFPVRIGREAPSECVLDFSFVSKVHARLDLHGDALVLRDGGSRNGTFVRAGGERVSATDGVPLADVNGEFQIGTLRLRAVVLVNGVRSVEHGGTGTIDQGGDMAGFRPPWVRVADIEAYEATDPGADWGVKHVDPGAAGAHATRKELELPLGTYRRARAELQETLGRLAATVDRARLVALLTEVAGDCPELVLPVEVREMLGAGRAEPPPSSQRVADAELALRGLRELAAWAVPNAPPLAGANEVIAFLQKLAGAFRALVESFASLREQHLAATGTTESARQLAASLLDWTQPGKDARPALEKDLVAIVQLHSQLVGEVARGKHLVARLSPLAFEEALTQARSAGCAGFTFGPFRWRALWKLFVSRFAEIATDEHSSAATALLGPLALIEPRNRSSGPAEVQETHLAGLAQFHA